MEELTIGDRVFWKDRPYHKGHEGEVVAVILKGHDPSNISRVIAAQLGCKPVDGPGSYRNQKSYIIHVLGKKSKGRLYWPRVKNLVKLYNETT